MEHGVGELLATCPGMDSAIADVAYLARNNTPVSIGVTPNSGTSGETQRYLVKLHDPETGQVASKEEISSWDYRLFLRLARSASQKPVPLTPLDAPVIGGIPGGVVGGVSPAQSPAAPASPGEGRAGGRRSPDLQEATLIHAFVAHFAEPGVAVSPDGQTLAFASAGDSIDVHDLASGGVRTLSTQTASRPERRRSGAASSRTAPVPLVNIPGDDRLVIWPNNNAIALVTTKDDGIEITLWAVQSGEQKWTRAFHDSRSRSRYRGQAKLVAISQDASRVAIVVDAALTSWRYYTHLSAEQHWIEVIDVGSGQTRLALPRQRDGITSIAFSPNGKLLASSDVGGAIRMWSLH